MWVTLEVPHPEQGRPPRQVRARVMWIQRPRTVRELFQVGVELEVAGNFWGIAFCPPDWFPFPIRKLELPAPCAGHLLDRALPEAASVASIPEAAEANELWLACRKRFPPKTTYAQCPWQPHHRRRRALPTLARQMERLVNEAKQQLRLASSRATPRRLSRRKRSHSWLHCKINCRRQQSGPSRSRPPRPPSRPFGTRSGTPRRRPRRVYAIDRSLNDELGRSLEQYHQKLEVRSGRDRAQQRESV